MKKQITIITSIEDVEYKFIPMTKEDIQINATIFYFDEEQEVMQPMVIDEVMNKLDEFKAFSANGCRYGIDGFYVMRYY